MTTPAATATGAAADGAPVVRKGRGNFNMALRSEVPLPPGRSGTNSGSPTAGMSRATTETSPPSSPGYAMPARHDGSELSHQDGSAVDLGAAATFEAAPAVPRGPVGTTLRDQLFNGSRAQYQVSYVKPVDQIATAVILGYSGPKPEALRTTMARVLSIVCLDSNRRKEESAAVHAQSTVGGRRRLATYDRTLEVSCQRIYDELCSVYKLEDVHTANVFISCSFGFPLVTTKAAHRGTEDISFEGPRALPQAEEDRFASLFRPNDITELIENSRTIVQDCDEFFKDLEGGVFFIKDLSKKMFQFTTDRFMQLGHAPEYNPMARFEPTTVEVVVYCVDIQSYIVVNLVPDQAGVFVIRGVRNAGAAVSWTTIALPSPEEMQRQATPGVPYHAMCMNTELRIHTKEFPLDHPAAELAHRVVNDLLPRWIVMPPSNMRNLPGILPVDEKQMYEDLDAAMSRQHESPAGVPNRLSQVTVVRIEIKHTKEPLEFNGYQDGSFFAPPTNGTVMLHLANTCVVERRETQRRSNEPQHSIQHRRQAEIKWQVKGFQTGADNFTPIRTAFGVFKMLVDEGQEAATNRYVRPRRERNKDDFEGDEEDAPLRQPNPNHHRRGRGQSTAAGSRGWHAHSRPIGDDVGHFDDGFNRPLDHHHERRHTRRDDDALPIFTQQRNAWDDSPPHAPIADALDDHAHQGRRLHDEALTHHTPLTAHHNRYGPPNQAHDVDRTRSYERHDDHDDRNATEGRLHIRVRDDVPSYAARGGRKAEPRGRGQMGAAARGADAAPRHELRAPAPSRGRHSDPVAAGLERGAHARRAEEDDRPVEWAIPRPRSDARPKPKREVVRIEAEVAPPPRSGRGRKGGR